MTLPAPLVPSKVDLRSYDWFPFHHKRLRQSAFWKRASDLACRVSVDLWAEAYEQVPAASLPDDDYLLADWAGFGRRDIDGWLAVKAEVMGAWILCSDGRWYHPTLSEVALSAWIERRIHLWSKECDRIRKENARRAKTDLPALQLPAKPSQDPFDEGLDHGNSDGSVIISGGRPMENEASEGRPAESIENPAENALTRTETETETETLKEDLLCSLRSQSAGARAAPEGTAEKPPLKSRLPRQHAFPAGAFDQWYVSYPHKIGRAAAEKAFAKVLISDMVSFDALITGVARYRANKPPEREWCNPATWLNQARWADEPAGQSETSPAGASAIMNGSEPRLDFGCGITAPHSTIRKVWRDRKWPPDWGPSPDQPGCRIPPELLNQIMGRAA